MAQKINIEFADDVSLYNAVSLANRLVGDYDITIQYNGRDYTGSYLKSDIDRDGNQSLSADEINNFINDPAKNVGGEIIIKPLDLQNSLIRDEDGSLTIATLADTRAEIGVSLAPAIKKSLTLDFKSPSQKQGFPAIGSIIGYFAGSPASINSYPYLPKNQLNFNMFSFRYNFSSGFKIDDGNPNTKIAVTIKNLATPPSGINLYNIGRTGDINANNYADFGALIDNHESVIIENLTLDSIWGIGDSQIAKLAAPVLNKPGADLTITGDVISGQAFQYNNSLVFNQGNLNIDMADIYFYDMSRVTNKKFLNTFNGAARAKGGIVNALGAQLQVSNSRISQESSDRGYEYTTDQKLLNTGAFATNKSTDGPEDPFSLNYLIENYGTLVFTDSELSGVVNTDGIATFTRSKLGQSKSSNLSGKNLNLRGGTLNLSQSLIDAIDVNASQQFSFNKLNSVVLKGRGSGDISDKLMSTLDPNRPSLFSDTTRPTVLLEDIPQFPTNINPLAYQTYDPNKLNPAVLSAVNLILGGGGASSTSGAPAGNNNSGAGESPDARNIVFKTTEAVTIKNTETKDNQATEIPEGRLIATKTHDHLIGDAFPDVFLFPNIKTGTNPKTKKHDFITNYHAYDQIEIDGFDVSVIGLKSSAKEIYDSYATIDNSKPKTIHKLFGNSLKPGKAAVFQVHGKPGSFLAVNTQGSGYNKHDMLVHITDFVPSTENPLVLI